MSQPNNLESLWGKIMSFNTYEQIIALVTILVVMLATLWYMSTFSKSLPPGPWTLPIVGYLPFLGPNLHRQFTAMANTYGPIFKFRVGSKLLVVINTPELAKVVNHEKDEIFANRTLSVASSIISHEGKDIIFSGNNLHWRKLRKIFVFEVLSNKNLKASSSFRSEEVRKTIKNVFSKIGTTLNISDITYQTELNIVTRMAWGDMSKTGASDYGTELQTLALNIGKIFRSPNLSDFFPSLAWFDLQGVGLAMKTELKKLDQIFARIVEDRRKRSQDGVIGHEGKKDFLQTLLDLMDQEGEKSLNLTDVKMLLADTMVAVTESVTRAVEWAMANIMHHPNVMKRVQEELTEIVGLNNIVEESHLPKLEYLDATIKETSRMYPVVPLLIPRCPSQDCMIGGYKIPKGSSVFINVWSIQRDPRYWDNPLEFNPERFLETNEYDYIGKKLKFFPFGSGRRMCPGIPLAEKMQMYILASLLHSFNWSLPKGEEHDFSEMPGLSLNKAKPLKIIPSQRLPDVSLYM